MTAALAGYLPHLPPLPASDPSLRWSRETRQMRRLEMQPWAVTLVHRVVVSVANEHGVTFGQIMGKIRDAHIVRARERAMALCRWSTGMSYPSLGALFGSDHTSIMAAVRRYERR